MARKIEINYIRSFRFCDRNHFMVVKGISVLAALAAYISHRFYAYPGLLALQQVAAAVFLLCSGFGLSETFEMKGGLHHFWENKVVKVWLPSILFLVLYYQIEHGNAIEWISKYPVGLKGNYLYLIFGNYAAFWLVFTFLDKKAQRIGSLLAMAAVAFLLVQQNSISQFMFCFPLGVMFSQLGWKRKVRRLQDAGKWTAFVVSGALAVGGGFLVNVIGLPYVDALLWNVVCLSGAAALFMGVYVLRKIPVFGIFAPFGYMAYPLFLMYREVLVLAVGKSGWRILAAVTAGLFVVSLLCSWLIGRLLQLNKNLRRRKNPHLKGSMR